MVGEGYSTAGIEQVGEEGGVSLFFSFLFSLYNNEN